MKIETRSNGETVWIALEGVNAEMTTGAISQLVLYVPRDAARLEFARQLHAAADKIEVITRTLEQLPR